MMHAFSHRSNLVFSRLLVIVTLWLYHFTVWCINQCMAIFAFLFIDEQIKNILQQHGFEYVLISIFLFILFGNA